MKTDIKYILYGLLLCMMMLSCSSADEIVADTDDEQVAKQVDLIVCVGNKASMPLQVRANTRSDATFNGMEWLVVIPFHTDGNAVASTDTPLINEIETTESSRVEAHNNYYVNRCYFETGTNRVLVYGKTSKPTPDPAVYGVLSPLPTDRTTLNNIRFSLSSIRNTVDPHTDAQALADYMTSIANTPGWSTTEDVTLKSYYQDFIHIGAEGTGLMSGAAANIKAFVEALNTLLTEKGGDLSNAIIEKINATDISGNTYPRSIGLPDGAAVIRWMGDHFEVRTTTTSLDNINGINRYTYPADLMFFTDSPIRTSTSRVPLATYQNAPADELWSDFLDEHYNSSSSISTDTKAVAVVNPLQFGVANLQLTLTGMSAELKDAKDVNVTNADMKHLPLTGVIIGGQHTVGYNMKPQGEQTDVDERFIYETTVDNTNFATEGYKTSTLVLQSYDNGKVQVPIILEFENNTGTSFTGKDGVVYPGTRFYLIGVVDPAGKGMGDYAGRVFTQDYTTTMSMNVTSLANAYTCMPDLLAPRLEIGVQIVTHWIQATTTNVEL